MTSKNHSSLIVAWIATLAFFGASLFGLIGALDQGITVRAWMYGISTAIWAGLLGAVGFQLWRSKK